MRYSVRGAALATGLTESRIRTWERRHGVPEPQRSSSGRRLYSNEDLDLLRRLASLVDAGVPASQAAEIVQVEAAPPPVDLPAARPAAVATIIEAAHRFDSVALQRALARHVRAHGWHAAVDAVVFPALREMAAAWERGECNTACEHFLAAELTRAFLLATPPARTARDLASRPHILLACPAGERQDVGLGALAMLLAQDGARCTSLGTGVPVEDLLECLRVLAPDAVCLFATAPTSRPALARASRAIVGERRSTRVYVGGPALADEATARNCVGAILPQTLAAATRVILTG